MSVTAAAGNRKVKPQQQHHQDSNESNKSKTFPPHQSNDSDMLTTPKIESGGGIASLLSPRGFPTPRFTPSSAAPPSGIMSNGHSGSGSDKDKEAGGDSGEMLTTPKATDLWTPSAAKELLAFSPTSAAAAVAGLSSPTPLELGPRGPPKDLPMDSDIGLRSPCDGLLAKRRKLYKQNKQGR